MAEQLREPEFDILAQARLEHKGRGTGEKLWRRCPDCHGELTWHDQVAHSASGHCGLDCCPCETCFDSDIEGMVPVASSALVIEDGFDNAVSRVRKWLAVRNGEATMLEVPSLLRAAVGEGDRWVC